MVLKGSTYWKQIKKSLKMEKKESKNDHYRQSEVLNNSLLLGTIRSLETQFKSISQGTI